ncbi:MAG TPA: hypothetical protein VGL91_07665 [Acidobacteriota bacterium]
MARVKERFSSSSASQSPGVHSHSCREGRTLLGCVLLARAQLYVFAEAKRHARDQIRESQRQWLAAGLRVGLNPDAFLIVEWELAAPTAAV